MKKFAIIMIVSLFVRSGLAGEETAVDRSQIIIFDIATSSYDPGKARLLTDVLRAEIFKTKLFNIIEKGIVQETSVANRLPSLDKADESQLLQIGRAARGDKLLICSIEKFEKMIAISIRIVDVKTALLDYTDNVFLADEAKLFDAIKEIAGKIDFYYASGRKSGDADPGLALKSRWEMLGAKDEDLAYLADSRIDPDEYLTIRQYDITFQPSHYAAILKSRIDPEIIRSFLQAGISFSQTERAISLGITKLDRYRSDFEPEGFTFEDYLTAYSKNIINVREYASYKKGYIRTYFDVGGGGVADSFPIANSVYRFGIAKFGWERFWTPYQRDFVKVSTDAGLYLLNVFAPTPYFQANLYLGAYPYYFKLGVGGHAEVILGGHAGLMLHFGLEILETLDFSVVVVPIGTQPAVSYTDLESRPGEPGYSRIKFPYAGVVVTYKIPSAW